MNLSKYIIKRSRSHAIECNPIQLQSRALDQPKNDQTRSWPQMLIFPEGTCTNGQALIKFKSGAFQVCM